MKDISLTSERLLLRRLSQEHVSPAYLSWLNDREVNMFLETKGNHTLEALRSYVADQYQNEVLFWAIHIKDSGTHIGNIKIDPIDPELHSGEYGILLGDRKSWGKGYAKEASDRIIEYCFNELKLSQITLGVIEDNIKAVKLYRNMGFRVDAIKKDAGIYNQKSCNALRMSLHVNNFKQ